MTALAAIGDPAVTAAAMRAAAVIIEESGLAGLSATCSQDQISIQVCAWAGNPRQRAAHVRFLAQIAGTAAYRHDARDSAYSEVRASGHACGIPLTIFTSLAIRTQPAQAGPVPLAVDPGGQLTGLPARTLPAPGWRWATELDDAPAPAAAEVTP